MAPRTQKATTNQSGYHRLRDEGQMQRDRQHHNEEQPEFQSTQQTTTQHGNLLCTLSSGEELRTRKFMICKS